MILDHSTLGVENKSGRIYVRQVYFKKSCQQVWERVSQPFILFIHHIWGEQKRFTVFGYAFSVRCFLLCKLLKRMLWINHSWLECRLTVIFIWQVPYLSFSFDFLWDLPFAVRAFVPAVSCHSCSYPNDNLFLFCQMCGYRRKTNSQTVPTSKISGDLQAIDNRTV